MPDMAKPRYNPQENVVLAACPGCDGATTSFDTKGHNNVTLGVVIINGDHQYKGSNFTRIHWQFFRCVSCSMGAVAKLHDGGSNPKVVLEEFFPHAVQKASLPPDVPSDIVTEFREAELDAAHGACRSGSALLRSVLEKL